jgi:glycosyltransferase involved in cell wall biosynthesis
MPDISFVIPAYNEGEFLLPTLDSIKEAADAQSDVTYEIIVTDNNSTDNTGELAEANGATVVFEPHNQIARARNSGAKVATGTYLIFVDADTQITPALLAATLEKLASGKVVGGGTILKGDYDTRFIRGALAVWISLSRFFGWACGAYVFCHRNAFEEVGGFDERFYASEEIHLSRALRKWGKPHKMKFVVLDEPITTSMRKLDWFGPLGFTWQFLRFLWPWTATKRKHCGLWYTRPED